jgi:transcriptional regulator with XRE-family HTH domain
MVDSKLLYPLIGKEITRLRKNKNWTQTDLAKAVSLTRTSITNIEKGRQKILVNTLWDIAEQFNIHPSKLLPKQIIAPSSVVVEVDKAKGLSDDNRKLIKQLIAEQEGNK